jgi:molybdenum transport protein
MSTVLPQNELERLLYEDCPYGDLTSLALGIDDRPAQMTFYARGKPVISAVEEAAAIIRLCGATVERHVPSGTTLTAGDEILSATGTAAALHRSWRVAQVLIETWAGVATAAAAIVQAAHAVSPTIQVACTRKMFPGTRALAVAAIRAGGAVPHRLGLSETILVFPQHWALLNDADARELRARLHAHAPEQKLTMEVANLAEALAAAEAGFDIVQLDKLDAAEVTKIVAEMQRQGHSTLVAAAGGINATTAADFAGTGIDIIVTSAPFSAQSADVRVTFEPT